MSKSYYDQLLDHLSETPTTIEDLMKKMDLPSAKQTYVIDAIKKGLRLQTIVQTINPSEVKRLYVYIGHLYSKA
jgi:hypothetical protein